MGGSAIAATVQLRRNLIAVEHMRRGLIQFFLFPITATSKLFAWMQLEFSKKEF